MDKVRNILLIINFEKNIPVSFLDKLSLILSLNHCLVYVLPETTERLSQLGTTLDFTVVYGADDIGTIDIAIVLGGDGSILRAAIQLCTYDIPILGINFGTLGYMAELEATDVALVEKVLSGDYVVESRMMLSPSIEHRDGTNTPMPHALNDIVLSNGPVARLLNFNVSCDGVLIEKCRADGMVISTPTGSTAYSMSAGGPVLAPALNAFCLTPICPHSFSNRPVILPGSSVVTLSDIETRENSVYVTVDGRLAKKLERGDKLVIRESEARTKLIRLKNNSFLSVLSSKLQDV